MTQAHDATLAGELLRCALTPRSTPAADTTYREALTAYLGDPVFRAVVDGVASGLGLRIVEGGSRGLVLAPATDSLFAFPGRDFRPSSNTSAEQRVVDGVLVLAIATACYPRAADLADDPAIARKPVTVDDVEQLLRDTVARLASDGASTDATTEERASGLEPAWRVLARLPEVRDTGDGRAGPRTSRQRIRRLLDRLTELGAFTNTTHQGQEAWRPTYRWQVQVQELAASALWEDVQRVLSPSPSPATP